jgi:predicted ArsR family transcriptional regulator
MIRKLIEKITSITRRIAHEAIIPCKETMYFKILGYLALTDDPILVNHFAKIFSTFRQKYAPRFTELNGLGMLKVVDKAKEEGRTVARYIITEKGREYLKNKYLGGMSK